jgi:recombinational DNA repair protein (RecF pathway)
VSCVAYGDVPIDEFNPDEFHCDTCGRDTPIEYVSYENGLYLCPYCLTWACDE